MSGSKSTVYFDKYGAGLQWDRTLFDDAFVQVAADRDFLRGAAVAWNFCVDILGLVRHHRALDDRTDRDLVTAQEHRGEIVLHLGRHRPRHRTWLGIDGGPDNLVGKVDRALESDRADGEDAEGTALGCLGIHRSGGARRQDELSLHILPVEIGGTSRPDVDQFAGEVAVGIDRGERESQVVNVEQLDALRRGHPELSLDRLGGLRHRAELLDLDIAEAVFLREFHHDPGLAIRAGVLLGRANPLVRHQLHDMMHSALARDFIDDGGHRFLGQERPVLPLLGGQRSRDAQRDGGACQDGSFHRWEPHGCWGYP